MAIYQVTFNSTNSKLVLRDSRQVGLATAVSSDPSTCPINCCFRGTGFLGVRKIDGTNMCGCYLTGKGCCQVAQRLLEGKGLNAQIAGDLIREQGQDLVRLFQLGDAAHKNGSIDLPELLTLATPRDGQETAGYTHHDLILRNVNKLLSAQRKGIILNVSCETFDRCDLAISYGLPAVLVHPESELDELPKKTDAGHKLLVCPHYTMRRPCVQRRMCWRVRDFVVVLPTHGKDQRKADEAVRKARLTPRKW